MKKVNYYPNLNAEMSRVGLSLRDIANSGRLKCSYNTLCLKIRGDYPFTLDECITLKKTIGTQLSLDELFLVNSSIKEGGNNEK